MASSAERGGGSPKKMGVGQDIMEEEEVEEFEFH